jgi:hypothetical protein
MCGTQPGDSRCQNELNATPGCAVQGHSITRPRWVARTNIACVKAVSASNRRHNASIVSWPNVALSITAHSPSSALTLRPTPRAAESMEVLENKIENKRSVIKGFQRTATVTQIAPATQWPHGFRSSKDTQRNHGIAPDCGSVMTSDQTVGSSSLSERAE